MANLEGNPWNFTTADVATTAAITSITNNTGSALITTTTPHGLAANAFISVQGATPLGWNGGYRVDAVPSTTTLIVDIHATFRMFLANAGAAGNIFTAAYMKLIEVTQMLWDGSTSGGTMTLTDLYGNTVWSPTSITGGTLTYAKVFPINGLVINALPTGTLQVSV